MVHLHHHYSFYAFTRFGLSVLAGLILIGQAWANTKDISRIAELSLEDLGNIEITSVSKRTQRLREAAASIYVITQDDIRRSGATSIPEALRLAPNLEVARYTSNGYAVAARGFNTRTSNKLLVLIDGRSVYTPLYSGVFWDMQDTLIEDIDRIEVISGPGASLWGANAVNGVINIITRSASDTQGTLVTANLGREEKGAGIRRGGKTDGGVAYRLYAKGFDRDALVNAAGNPRPDAWHNGQGGFRIDSADDENARDAQTWTLQGDFYHGSSEQALRDNQLIEGGNLLGKWGRDLKNGHIQVQAYYDHTKREYQNLFKEVLNTLDIDIQHRFRLGEHELLWGGGYRYIDDQVQNSTAFTFLPAHARLRNLNLFIQDRVDLIPDTLKLSLGTKFEHNSYSGLDIQPDARLSWKVSDQHQLWTGISRAARAPSRIDRDWYISGRLTGGPNFVSEFLTAYQLGYRGQPSNRLTLSATLFYNEYKKLRSVERNANGIFFLSNRMSGSANGAELWSEFQLTPSWRLHAGYTYLEKHLHLPADNYNPSATSGEGNDPRHQFRVRSSLDLPHNIEFDTIIRHVSALPNPAIPAYTAMDFRLGWKPVKEWEVALVAQNLLDSQHPEFDTAASRGEIERSVFIKSVWKF